MKNYILKNEILFIRKAQLKSYIKKKKFKIILVRF